ncbi:MAG: tRNA (guanosine(37)-N1)-methyltransferase TrmD [Planctomycetota bacterium]
MRFDIVTLFPEIFDGYLRQGLLGKAISRELVSIHRHQLRDFAPPSVHKPVDDRPFGGGPGMLIQVEPTVRCVEAVRQMGGDDDVSDASSRSGQTVLLTPAGETFNQPMAEEMAAQDRLILICGRYEGFDQRVVDILKPREVSVGDFVLNGGEVAAMLMIDAISRLIPGVLGESQSHVDDSFSQGNRLLEFPQYTRPRTFRGHAVPDVLLSGDHEKIARWRAEQVDIRTRERRRDLIDDAPNPTRQSFNQEKR